MAASSFVTVRELETAVAHAICVEQFKERQLEGEPTAADVDQVRGLAAAALKAIKDCRTVACASDVPIPSVVYNHADRSVVARVDQDKGFAFGVEHSFAWKEKYLEGELTVLFHPDDA
ncbi:Uncharacterised protein [Mycobacteroides abscessus subsp. abscessus]|uniref:hypothetical protein n=1 Tax=Mycobacteroides abscessus TaxID=36809 RepID=UPI000926BE39|nr:hypothetical protein [Mycobacteroides abscessus]SHU66098.1 Uncharacterised protein [Mycobacteroides abscessus subsp. abscessus]